MKPIKARAGTPLPRWTQVLAPGCCSPGPKNRKSRTKLLHNSKSYPDSVFCGSSIGLEAHDRAIPKQILKEPPDPILQSLVQLRIQNEWHNLSMIFTSSRGGLPTRQSTTKSWSCKDTSFYSLWPGNSYPSHIFPVIPVPRSHSLLGLFFNGQEVHRFSRDVWPTELKDGMCSVFYVHSAPPVHSVPSDRPTHAILWLCKSGTYCRIDFDSKSITLFFFLSVVWEPF